MKTIIYKISSMFVLILFMQSNIFSQDKKVVWVHGLGDATKEPDDENNKSCWSERYAQEFQTNRKMNSTITNYLDTKKSGVEEYAKAVSSSSANADGGIAIGHSMGGMAIRHIDVYNTGGRKFKGIITFASPLTGANIINDIPATSRFIENTTYNVLRPLGWALPVVGAGSFLVGQYLVGTLAIMGGTGGASIGVGLMTTGAIAAVGGGLMNVAAGMPGPFIVRDLIANPAANYLINKKSTKDSKTRCDLAENSDYVRQFDNTKTATPKIHIWGNEDNPVTWNMLSSAIHPDFGKYISQYADVCNVLQYVTGYYFTPVGYSFGEAYDFFRSDGRGNAQWSKDILHASHTKRQTYEYWKWNYVSNCYTDQQTQASQSCNSWGWFGWLCKAVMTIVNIFRCFWESIATLCTGYYDQEILDRSDGTVTEWSAQGQYPPDLYDNKNQQAWSQDAISIKADGVNHSEFRNHKEIDKIFRDRIWNGDEKGNGIVKPLGTFAIEKRSSGF